MQNQGIVADQEFVTVALVSRFFFAKNIIAGIPVHQQPDTHPLPQRQNKSKDPDPGGVVSKQLQYEPVLTG